MVLGRVDTLIMSSSIRKCSLAANRIALMTLRGSEVIEHSADTGALIKPWIKSGIPIPLKSSTFPVCMLKKREFIVKSLARASSSGVPKRKGVALAVD